MSPRAGRTRPLLHATVEGVVAALVIVNLIVTVVYLVGEVPVDETRAVAHLALAVAFTGWLTAGRDLEKRKETVDTPDPGYARYPGHPLAWVPLDALRIARGQLAARAGDVDWDDPEDVRAVADALVAELALGGHLRRIQPNPGTEER